MQGLQKSSDATNHGGPERDRIGERHHRLASPSGHQLMAVTFGQRGVLQHEHGIQAEQATLGTQHRALGDSLHGSVLVRVNCGCDHRSRLTRRLPRNRSFQSSTNARNMAKVERRAQSSSVFRMTPTTCPESSGRTRAAPFCDPTLTSQVIISTNVATDDIGHHLSQACSLGPFFFQPALLQAEVFSVCKIVSLAVFMFPK